MFQSEQTLELPNVDLINSDTPFIGFQYVLLSMSRYSCAGASGSFSQICNIPSSVPAPLFNAAQTQSRFLSSDCRRSRLFSESWTFVIGTNSNFTCHDHCPADNPGTARQRRCCFPESFSQNCEGLHNQRKMTQDLNEHRESFAGLKGPQYRECSLAGGIGSQN
jgi:hypothetical protein